MKRKRLLLAAGGMILLCAAGAALVWNGVILLNRPSKADYPVRGVDVSSYQGEIDWPVLAGQDLRFAFVKATEGSSYTDPKFAYNWEEARKTELKVGAYHFFSYDSGGDTQAEHFIRTVPNAPDMLPPVIDVEFYGDKEKNPPDPADVDRELSEMVRRLTAHYGRTPILYATEKSFRMYLSDGYTDCDIWIRSVFFPPDLNDRRSWTFWQYTNRARLKGYEGKERFIDLNVFRGSEEAFEEYMKPGQREE